MSMNYLVKALLLAMYPLLLLAWAVNRLCEFDRLRLRRHVAGEGGWIERTAQPDVLSYFSLGAPREGRSERSAGRMVTALLVIAAGLFRRRKARAGTPYKSAVAREEGIPEEVYTLW